MKVINKRGKYFLNIATILLPSFIFYSSYALSAKPTEQVSLVFNQDYGAIPATAANDPAVNGYYRSQQLCDKPTVVEFFSYGCGGCYTIDKTFSNWLATKPTNISFKRVAVVFHPGWEQLAKIYYVNEAYGVSEQLHTRTFEWFQKELDIRKGLTDEAVKTFISKELANNPAVKGKFTVEQYMKDYNSSPAVASKIKEGMRLFSSYTLLGTPSVVVNNKYTITLDQFAKSPEAAYKKMIDTINGLAADSKTSCSSQNNAKA